MWWVGNKRLDIYIGSQAFMTELDGQTSVLAVDGFDAAIAALRAWIEAHPGRYSIHLWLSGGLCRPFVMPEATGTKNSEERMAVVRALGSDAMGLALGDPMACAVQVSDNLGVAVEAATLDALNGAVAPCRVKSIQPWWACALNAQLAHTPGLEAFAVHDCDSLTLLFGSEQGYSHTSTISPIGSQAAASGAWDRALMAQDHDLQHRAFVRLGAAMAVPSRAPDTQAMTMPFAQFVEVVQ